MDDAPPSGPALGLRGTDDGWREGGQNAPAGECFMEPMGRVDDKVRNGCPGRRSLAGREVLVPAEQIVGIVLSVMGK